MKLFVQEEVGVGRGKRGLESHYVDSFYNQKVFSGLCRLWSQKGRIIQKTSYRGKKIGSPMLRKM